LESKPTLVKAVTLYSGSETVFIMYVQNQSKVKIFWFSQHKVTTD